MPNVKNPPEGHAAVTPYLVVNGADSAIAFYKKVFGATERMRMKMNGRIGHAEIAINNCPIMLADEFPEMNATAPKPGSGTPASLYLYLDDVDSVFKRAIDQGAKEVMPPKDQFYGDRGACIIDPFGHKWFIARHIEDVPQEEMNRRMAEMKPCNKNKAA